MGIPKILITTRFSFFGSSGWKSEFAADPEMLFERKRLHQRFWLYENITLPSLASQTHANFHYFVLSSQLMPRWAKIRLRELCKKFLGEGRFTIRFARPGPERKYQRMTLEQIAERDDEPIAQVVLDDDDALAADFVENLRQKLDAMEDQSLPHFMTFPVGYVLGLRESSTCMWRHGYKFINLGLTMIGTADMKNVFGINHRSAPKRLGFTADFDRPMYIRTLSNVNDSHADVKDKWVPILGWTDQPDIDARFAFLKRPDFSDYHKLPTPEYTNPLTYVAPQMAIAAE